MSLKSILTPNNFQIYAGVIKTPLIETDNIIVQNDVVTDTLIVDKIIFTDSTKGSILAADGLDYQPLNVGLNNQVLMRVIHFFFVFFDS